LIVASSYCSGDLLEQFARLIPICDVNALDCAVEASKDKCSGEKVLGSLSGPARVSVNVESLRAGWILWIPLSQPEAEPKIFDAAFDENLNLSRLTFDCRFRRCSKTGSVKHLTVIPTK